ncbi:hypothetical protein J559_0681 [Acinetobacter sp. 983759]|uniref:hypothetical protein n=1 Tax=Acinetobacter sp. 983759 TaxID=1310660 RepID=UPI000448A3CA|nr:hypothetical protein [Acinetobacter sp. 983759]EXE15549.1 hypothetical protein J559_0681 [Acinetobacter sp. 983759]
MDIQKEREVFEAIPEIKDKITSYKMDFVNGSYDSLFSHINAWMDGAWFLFQEKAKAQAVPDQLDVNSILHDIDCYFDNGLSNTERAANNLLQSIYEKLGGEVKAQEQDHA